MISLIIALIIAGVVLYLIGLIPMDDGDSSGSIERPRLFGELLRAEGLLGASVKALGCATVDV